MNVMREWDIGKELIIVRTPPKTKRKGSSAASSVYKKQGPQLVERTEARAPGERIVSNTGGGEGKPVAAFLDDDEQMKRLNLSKSGV
jgi:hypothetical protein